MIDAPNCVWWKEDVTISPIVTVSVSTSMFEETDDWFASESDLTGAPNSVDSESSEANDEMEAPKLASLLASIDLNLAAVSFGVSFASV
jgi:hypothetical protein